MYSFVIPMPRHAGSSATLPGPFNSAYFQVDSESAASNFVFLRCLHKLTALTVTGTLMNMDSAK
jgi:hypothetical protein